jgi:hypothetical protein
MAATIQITTRVKRISSNPFLFGLGACIMVAIFSAMVPIIARGSLEEGFSMFLDNGIFIFLVPVTAGIQMGLFMYHRNLSKAATIYRLEKVGVSGAAISSLGMVACCVCCIPSLSGILPVLGLSLASLSFLTRYKDLIILAGLLINVLGIAVMLRVIANQKK